MEAQTEPEVKQVIETALSVVPEARGLAIITADDYQAGQGYMKKVKEGISTLTDRRMSITRKMDAAKAEVMDLFRPPLQKLEDAKAYLNTAMVNWAQERERIRQADEKRLNELAKKREEEEKLAAAIEEEQNGNVTEAEKILSEPVSAPPVKVASSIPKANGSHLRTTWSAEVVDLLDLVRAIGLGKAPIQAVAPDMVFLNKQATAYKDALKIPGVKAVSKTTQV